MQRLCVGAERNTSIDVCVFVYVCVNESSNPPDSAPSLQTSNSGQTHSDQTKSHSRQAILRSPLLSSVRHLHLCRSLRPLPHYTVLPPVYSCTSSPRSTLAFLVVCLMHSLNYVENFLYSTSQWKMWTLLCVCVCFFHLIYNLKPLGFFMILPQISLYYIHSLSLSGAAKAGWGSQSWSQKGP